MTAEEAAHAWMTTEAKMYYEDNASPAEVRAALTALILARERAARVEALREAAEAVPPGRTDATDAFRAQIKAWLAARATAEEGRT